MAKETYNHSYREVIDLISEDLGYQKGDKFNTFIVKKLKTLRENYADEVIADVVKNEGWKIRGKHFDKQYNKIAYYFAIIKNNISYYNKKYNEKKSFNEKIKLQNENNFIEEDIFSNSNNRENSGNKRDISSILEDF